MTACWRMLACAAACTCWLAACGGAQTPSSDPLPSADRRDDFVPGEEITPLDGWPYLVEAWPTAAEGEPVERVSDGSLATGAYRPAESVPRPYSMIFSIQDGPREVAAVGVQLDADTLPAAESVTVFGYLGSVPVTRANYGQVIEGSIRLGVAEVADSGAFVILELPEPRLLHYVWVRLSTPVSDTHVGITEAVIYAPGHLRALHQRAPGDVQFASLVDVDTTAYQDVSVSGLPVIDAADIDPAEEIERFRPPTVPQNDASDE